LVRLLLLLARALERLVLLSRQEPPPLNLLPGLPRRLPAAHARLLLRTMRLRLLRLRCPTLLSLAQPGRPQSSRRQRAALAKRQQLQLLTMLSLRLRLLAPLLLLLALQSRCPSLQ
jgi:hypothetical protein